MDFSAFEEGVEVGYVFKRPMKRQTPEGGVTSAINALGTGAQAATMGALVGSTIMNLVMSGALA